MKQIYDVCLGDRAVGTAHVVREGLYYRIHCRCEQPGEGICRVVIRCDEGEEGLGILVPEDGMFTLETRIPVKKIGEGKLSFRIVPRHSPLKGRFIPLTPEEPFNYISRLQNAFLQKRNGITGIVIKEPGCQ